MYDIAMSRITRILFHIVLFGVFTVTGMAQKGVRADDTIPIHEININQKGKMIHPGLAYFSLVHLPSQWFSIRN